MKFKLIELNEIDTLTNESLSIAAMFGNYKFRFNQLNKIDDEAQIRVFNVKYTIENPALHGAKQEISGTFYFNEDATKIVAVK